MIEFRGRRYRVSLHGRYWRLALVLAGALSLVIAHHSDGIAQEDADEKSSASEPSSDGAAFSWAAETAEADFGRGSSDSR